LLVRGYKGTVGGKTGFTSKAGRTFWAAATRGGHTLVVTLLQISQPTETAAESLLTWGFRNRTTVTPVGTLVDPLPEGVSPTPQESAPAPVGSANAVGPTSGSQGSASDAGVPGWAWLLGLLLMVGGAVALVVGRRRTPEAPVAAASSPPVVGTTVLPSRGAAARTSPSVVVSTPGRRVDVELDDPSPVEPAAPEAAPPVAAGIDASTALDATGPVPVVPAPVAAAAAAAPMVEVAGAADEDQAPEASPAPTPTAPQGGNVRVIRPPGPGSA
jgi:D-alanyl-D-alanine carboxypeptidase (penicillin-binding protein 5/6)